MNRLTTWCSLALVLLWLGVASSSVASDDAFKIVVHRSNPVATVSRDFLRDIFLKRATQWSDGEVVHPIDLAKGLAVRDRFTRDVLDKTPPQLRSYWTQRIFSGTDIPPPEAESSSAAIAYVLTHPGAVAYVPVSADTRGAKVIGIR